MSNILLAIDDKAVHSLRQADVVLQPITYMAAGISLFTDFSLTDWVLLTALVTGIFNSFFAATRFVDYWRKPSKKAGVNKANDKG